MFNLEHEIELKKNKKILHFLGLDYFHDSIIKEFKFINKSDLGITLFCIREWDNDYQKGNTINYKNINLEDDKYLYKLSFKNCVHFEFNSTTCYPEYLSGRFKNSIKVQELNSKTKKNYLHFRIELSEGFMDIIFKAFDIKKVLGKLKYIYEILPIIPFEVDIQAFANLSISKVHKIALNDEQEKYNAMKYLILLKDAELESIALKNINVDDLEVQMLSVWILGNFSTNEKIIWELYKRRTMYKDILYKKVLDEAIESINYKKKLTYK